MHARKAFRTVKQKVKCQNTRFVQAKPLRSTCARKKNVGFSKKALSVAGYIQSFSSRPNVPEHFLSFSRMSHIKLHLHFKTLIKCRSVGWTEGVVACVWLVG